MFYAKSIYFYLSLPRLTQMIVIWLTFLVDHYLTIIRYLNVPLNKNKNILLYSNIGDHSCASLG